MQIPPGLPAYSNQLFTPSYRPFKGQRWELRQADMVLCQGYWSDARLVVGMAALLREEEDGIQRTWMSMTPLEIESQELGCLHAEGEVVVMGLGMGWAAANAALQDKVTAVTVVEFDPEVIQVVEQSGVFGQLPENARAKLRIVQDSAYEFVPARPATTLLADIWLRLFGAERDAELRGMRDRTGAAKVYFWGQELLIAHRARQAGLELNRETVARVVAAMGLPLIGPAECPDYPEKVAMAAAKWLKVT